MPLAGVLLTIVVIVFCELAPKIYAASNPEGVALHAAGIYRVLVLVARPALWLTNSMAYGFLRLFGVGRAAHPSQALSAEELRTVVTEAAPVIPARHRQMLLSILDLGHVTVNDIMIPRQEISGIDLNESWEDILDRLRADSAHPAAGVRGRARQPDRAAAHEARGAASWCAASSRASGSSRLPAAASPTSCPRAPRSTRSWRTSSATAGASRSW